MCQCTSMSYNKCTTLLGDTEAIYVWGEGVHGKSLYLPLNFALNLKLLHNIKSLKNYAGKIKQHLSVCSFPKSEQILVSNMQTSLKLVCSIWSKTSPKVCCF